MQFGFKELNDEEKDLFFGVLSSAAAEIPELIKDLGTHSSALFGVGYAGYKFLRSRHEYKKFIQHFENESRKLIPYNVNFEEANQIFKAVEGYIKKIRNEEKKLSFYYLHKEKAPELVECLFKECVNVLKDKKITDEVLRSVLTNLVSILIQNNKGVMLLTELSDITKDILDRLKQDGKNIDILMNDVEAIKKALDGLPPKYMTYINNAELPSVINSNIFSFRNPNITFCGRENELTKLKEWIRSPGISVWGITGPGGIGKSRLALHLAQLDDAEWKSVWLDAPLLKALLDCTDFSCNKPVLFICDYASQYETQLEELIDKMSWTNTNAKFLFLERLDSWYKEFRRKKDIIKEYSLEEPIKLENSVFSDDDYYHIMQDISDCEYEGKIIPCDVKSSIIEKSKDLSDGEGTVRCLFLMLFTDAYLRDESIQVINAEELLYNYIEHSKKIISDKYGEVITDSGLRVLAYATVCDGIKWEESYPAVQRDLDKIMEHFPDDRERINDFFSQLSETEKSNTVAAFKPDLIGEFLFLNIWDKLFKSSRIKWISELCKNNYSKMFLARCMVDWQENINSLESLFFEENADNRIRYYGSAIFSDAVCISDSESIQMKYLDRIKLLDTDNSVIVLANYIMSINYIFSNAISGTRKKCIEMIRAIEWNQYSSSSDEESYCHELALLNAAEIFHSNGDYDEALMYYRKTLEINLNSFGNEVENERTARIYNNMALIYKIKSDYKSALENYKKALDISIRFFGDYTPNTTIVYSNIASIYKELHDFEKALTYAMKDLESCEKEYGFDHHNTAICYNNIANIYQCDGKIDEALKWFKKGLDILEKTLGEKHIRTASLYDGCAGAYRAKSEYGLAERLYKRALQIREEVLGDNHPDTAYTYYNLAGVYKDLRRLDEAMHFYEKALIIRKNTYGEINMNTSMTYNGMGNVYDLKGDYKNALSCYKNALGIRKELFGEEDLSLAVIYDNIAELYYHIGERNTAIFNYRKALNIRKKGLDRNHPDIASTYCNLAAQYYEKRDYDNAIRSYQEVLKIREKVLGKNHIYTAFVYYNLAALYFLVKKYEKSLEYAKKSEESYETNYDEKNEGLQRTYQVLLEIYTHKKNHKKILYYQKKLCNK